MIGPATLKVLTSIELLDGNQPGVCFNFNIARLWENRLRNSSWIGQTCAKQRE